MNIQSVIESLFPFQVSACVHDGSGDVPELYPEEMDAVASAVDKRRAEFAFGRWCARGALVRHGMTAVPIPRGADRAPVWPDGAVGSITHCDRLVAAVIADRASATSLGLDAELACPVETDVARAVLAEGEAASDAVFFPVELRTKVIFCAKEALHKCIHPITGVMLDFREVRVIHGDAGDYRLEPIPREREIPAVVRRVEGRVVISGAHIVAGASLPA